MLDRRTTDRVKYGSRTLPKNKHKYRAGVAELNAYLGDIQNGERPTDKHTRVCIELVLNFDNK